MSFAKTPRKVSQYGVFSGLHFLVFGLNLRSHSVYKKIRTRKNSVFAHFSRSVNYTYHKSGFFDIFSSFIAFLFDFIDFLGFVLFAWILLLFVLICIRFPI